MASLEEIFQNPAYRHVVLNHLPLTGLFVAWIVLVVGVFARQRAISLLGLVLVAVTDETQPSRVRTKLAQRKFRLFDGRWSVDLENVGFLHLGID